jgi:hypothetical protein
MNTFSDLQATELDLSVTLEITPIGHPNISVWVNNELITGSYLAQPTTIHHRLPLLEPFEIKIQLLEKDYTAAQETAAVIESLRIDNFELVPLWTQLAVYQNDHDYQSPTNYLGFVGTWTLTVDCAFYQWLHSATGQGLLLTLDQ